MSHPANKDRPKFGKLAPADYRDQVVTAALGVQCEECGARPGEPCTRPRLDGTPFGERARPAPMDPVHAPRFAFGARKLRAANRAAPVLQDSHAERTTS